MFTDVILRTRVKPPRSAMLMDNADNVRVLPCQKSPRLRSDLDALTTMPDSSLGPSIYIASIPGIERHFGVGEEVSILPVTRQSSHPATQVP
jgi:hypothetical protein